MKYRLRNGILLTPNGTEELDLLINGKRIEALIGREESTSEEYVSIDCNNLYVSAGFVDIHQHGGGGSDYMDATADAYLQATDAHLRHGTTSIMPTLLSADKDALLTSIRAYRKAKQDPRITCNLLGLHIEGPYISPFQAGAQKPEHIRCFDADEYREIANVGDGEIKRWSVAPEVKGAQDFAAFASANGITLSIAHSNADFDTVKRAFDWGFRHVTHLYSCISTITRRNGFRVLGVLEAAYLLDGMNVEIIADGCHLPHELLSYVTKFKENERIALITDAMRAAGQDTAESFLGSSSDPLPVIVEDGVAKLTDRSAFGGSVATADRLVRNMLQSGSTLGDAVKMITVNPLRMMGLSVKKGELRPAYDADVCVFDRDIQIKHVFCNGTPVCFEASKTEK